MVSDFRFGGHLKIEKYNLIRPINIVDQNAMVYEIEMNTIGETTTKFY